MPAILPRLLGARHAGCLPYPVARAAWMRGCASRKDGSDSRLYRQSRNRHGRRDRLRKLLPRNWTVALGAGRVRDGRYRHDHQPRRRRRQHFDRAGLKTAAQCRRDRAIFAYCNWRRSGWACRPSNCKSVKDGVVSVKGDESKKRFLSGRSPAAADLERRAQGVRATGFSLNVEGTGKPKDPSAYTVVGKSASPRGHAGQDLR